MAIERIIAKNLRRLRDKRGYTQEQVAKLLDVRRATVSDWETGKRTIDSVYLKKVADVYGVSVDDFYTKPDDEPDMTQAVA